MTAPGNPEARLREDAMSVVRAGLRAVDPCALIEDALRASPPQPEPGGRLLVVAVGKADGGMLRGARLAPYAFFREFGDLVTTGPTGTNVLDLMGILAGPPVRPPGSPRT